VTSSAGSSTAVDCALRPSLRGLQWLFWLHVIPACALPLATTEPLYALPILALVALSWWRSRRHPALGFGPRAIVRILARADGSWWIETAAGGQSAELLPDSLLTGWLLVLNFRGDDGKRHARVVMAGDTDDDALRRLRARLHRPSRKQGGNPSTPQ
jgi:toxin CptA